MSKKLGTKVHIPDFKECLHLPQDYNDEDFVECALKTSAMTMYHPMGTARIGGVLDSDYRYVSANEINSPRLFTRIFFFKFQQWRRNFKKIKKSGKTDMRTTFTFLSFFDSCFADSLLKLINFFCRVKSLKNVYVADASALEMDSMEFPNIRVISLANKIVDQLTGKKK